MSLLSWNVQGLGNPWTMRQLRSLIKELCPAVVFLMETRIHDSEAVGIRFSFPDYNLFVVNPTRRAGGLMLLWKKEMDIWVTRYSKHFIDFEVKEEGSSKWRGTGIYGWPYAGDKHLTWRLLRTLKSFSSLPWLCFGDFNEVLSSFEKKGGRLGNSTEMNAFRQTCEWCSLNDIGAAGVKFTWDNRRQGESNVAKRLDRFLASSSWMELFPLHSTQNLARVASDHGPIFMKLNLNESSYRTTKKFKFEAMWLRDEGLINIVSQAWNEGLTKGLSGDPVALLTHCGDKLSTWNWSKFGHVQRELKQKTARLEKLQIDQYTRDTSADESKLQGEIKELLIREEILWRQRSRVQWLKEGDRNTRFFHFKASNRRRRNKISRLRDEVGNWVADDEGLGNLVSNYFEALFTTSQPSECDDVARALDVQISDEEAFSLEKPISSAEVHGELMQMAPLKAPGPDGMPAIFYQKFWSVVGPTVVSVVSTFFRTGNMPRNLNHTIITLIPKTSHPESLKDIRPISLCNVLYKIISKVLVNRLKPILPRIVHETQSAFVSERMITDNAIIAFEVFHWLKNKRNGTRGSLALKLDMSKAYDRVEWPFISSILRRMRFPPHFVRLIMACISTVSFSFNINGKVQGHVTPTREVLSRLIRKGLEIKTLHGIKICRNAPTISHLFFADDSLFFTRATPQECESLKNFIDKYCKASGQVVNYDKSEITFSPNVTHDTRTNVMEILGVREVTHQNKYLGLPTIVGRSKKIIFQAILDKVTKKVTGWKEKMLSTGGKEVLIKSVAQAIPVYVMSIFELPDSLIDDMHKILNEFWWGNGNKRNPIRWTTWERLCVSKYKGGLGFRHLGIFNKALLAKQGWRLIKHPDSLVAKVLKARYFPRSSFLDAKVGYRPSFVWRSISSGINLISQGSAWNIGNGQSVDIWNDKWLPGMTLQEMRPSQCDFHKVRDLMVDDGSEWDVVRIHTLFPAEIVKRILATHIASHRNDSLYWEGTVHGNFTVGDAYKKALANRGPINNLSDLDTQICSSLWKATIPAKVKLFIWRAWRNLLPTVHNLQRRYVILNDGLCVHCNDPHEDVLHALFKCDRVRQVWEAANFINISATQNKDSVNDYFAIVVSDHRNKREVFLMICWSLWLERNRIAHGQSPQDSGLIWQGATRLLQEFQEAAMRGNVQSGTSVDPLASIWQPPPYGFVKINCDAAWLPSSRQVGLGFVARNSDGEIILSGAKHVEYSESVLIAEAEAVWWAVKIANEKHLTRIEIETDSLVLYQSLSNGNPLQHISSMWQDIKDLTSTFECCRWTFVKRGGNVIAHSIARWALGDIVNSVVDGLVHHESNGCTLTDTS